MNILEQIKACKTEEELKQLTEEAIEHFTNKAFRENDNNGLIGSALDINPLDYHLGEPDFAGEKLCYCVNVWNGYVPKGTKIVYGRFYDEELKVSSNRGCYYYVDDDSYVYEFFKFIKKKEIKDEFELIIATYEFTERYFERNIGFVDREDIHKMIYKNDKLLFEPVREHSIKDFKKNGSALCTERALFAENLLSIMNQEMIYMMDYDHAYNFFVYHKCEETEIYVLDFSEFVDCFNEKLELVGTTPYLQKIDGSSEEVEEKLDKMINEGIRIVLDDYYLYRVNGSVYQLENHKTRSYGIDHGTDEEKKLVL